MQCAASSWYRHDAHPDTDPERYGPQGKQRCIYHDMHMGPHKDSTGAVFWAYPLVILRNEEPDDIPPEPDLDDPTIPTMPLDEFLRRGREDSNLWWRLRSGDGQNLLEEAVDRIDALVARTHVVVSRYTRYDARVITHVYGPYTPAQAHQVMQDIPDLYADHMQVGEDMEVSVHQMAQHLTEDVQPLEVGSHGF